MPVSQMTRCCRTTILVLAMFLCHVALAGDGDVLDGQRMYQEGLLSSGEPLTAIVTGDVEVLGTQFSCLSCHGQSGMGAAEGNYIVPPIAGQFLFSESPQPARPAYDEESLATVMRDGVTPSGRQLNQLMPRYKLTEDEVAALAAYLRGLSSEQSPGVDDRIIRFAAVVTPDVPREERDAVFAVLDRFVEEKNRQTRLDSERWDRGNTPDSRLPTVHRDWVLEEWALTGPPGTWAAQLEKRYSEAPVFAMLSGLGHTTWGPVARYCESNRIPCLFPGTDLAEREPGDFYTLYFSGGLHLEADLIANHLASDPVPNVVQVYCDVGPAQAADGLRTTLEAAGVGVSDYRFDCASGPDRDAFDKVLSAAGDAAVVAWLGQGHVQAIGAQLDAYRVYYSATLLGGELDGAYRSIRGSGLVAHPYRLPGRSDPAFARFGAWAKTRGIELTSPRRQAEAFFACFAMKDMVAHLGRYFIRDFGMDMMDHAQSLLVYLAYYPRPTLGPRQRFVNKGGYILPVTDGMADTKAANWIIP